MLCAACAGSPPSGAGQLDGAGSWPADSDTVTALAPESLHIRLDVPAETRTGRAVPIVIKLENRGERLLELYLRGRTITFDIFIATADGQPVWQRLKDEVIPAIIQLRTLRPGEVLELKEQWDQRGDDGEAIIPGSYMVRGVILTDGPRPLETAPASLRIVPG
jgi:hypothetical protein